MRAKKQVREFKRKYGLYEINSACLCDVLSAQGYAVVEFNGVSDSVDVNSLVVALNLEDQVSHSKCFTYRSAKYRIVFIHEDLNEEERTIALAHEEGHIINKHLTQDCVFGDDVVQEHEANEFSHYLLDNALGRKSKTALIASFCAVIMIAGIIVVGIVNRCRNMINYTDDLFRTETGTKYHIRNCMYIRDKSNVYRLSIEEYESGEYTPCKACLPCEK